ncbi:unnamed protein product [Trifolium pratense]|uniref:Uncharacterized protein n=1 Tax=Trifolium pratense TaxID=57577 RepID=A0ACB0JIC7_TRIPR|nr:unnamed protein product [Trifolium pratense]
MLVVTMQLSSTTFLMLQNVVFSSKNFSPQPLSKLNMLIFYNCDMIATDVSLFPKKLKTLCIWCCFLPLGLELPNLKYLRKLECLISKRYVRYKQLHEVIMVPNAISSLSSLEELHIPTGFRISEGAQDIMLILDEISKLTRLTSLMIYFRDFEHFQGTPIFFKLLKYHICVGDRRCTLELPNSSKVIELHHVKVKRDESITSLVERAEEVTLWPTDIDVSSIYNSNREAFMDLRGLRIDLCDTVEYIAQDTVEYIARISQNEIQRICQPRTSFSKLTFLHIGEFDPTSHA